MVKITLLQSAVVKIKKNTNRTIVRRFVGEIWNGRFLISLDSTKPLDMRIEYSWDVKSQFILL